MDEIDSLHKNLALINQQYSHLTINQATHVNNLQIVEENESGNLGVAYDRHMLKSVKYHNQQGQNN